MKILIAEDNEVTRQLLERKLTKWGYQVISTKDGTEAWDLMKTPGSPNLLILDWMMPRMDGVELCRKIHQLDGNVPKYIIFLTSKRDKEGVVCALEAGANDYITKPFNHNELRARVNVGHRIVKLESALADKVNKLEQEITNRKQMEEALQKSEAYLHELVTEKTHEIQLTQRTSIEALAMLAEYHDVDTGTHLKRIQGFVRLSLAPARENA